MSCSSLSFLVIVLRSVKRNELSVEEEIIEGSYSQQSAESLFIASTLGREILGRFFVRVGHVLGVGVRGRPAASLESNLLVHDPEHGGQQGQQGLGSLGRLLGENLSADRTEPQLLGSLLRQAHHRGIRGRLEPADIDPGEGLGLGQVQAFLVGGRRGDLVEGFDGGVQDETEVQAAGDDVVGVNRGHVSLSLVGYHINSISKIELDVQPLFPFYFPSFPAGFLATMI